MKSLTGLWKGIAADYAAQCDTSFVRDCQTVDERVEKEGLSFLTITLPAFCSDFEKALADGCVGSNLFAGFSKRGGLPRFLSGFLLQVFDAQSLEVLPEPSIIAVRAIRQLCLVFKKIEMPCADWRITRAQMAYLDCERDLKDVLKRYDELPIEEFRRVSSILFGPVFDRLNKKVQSFEIVPGHGPGATADRKVGNQKFVQSEWTDRLEEYFPYGEYALPHWKWYSTHTPEFLAPEEERPVRVVLVPKTLKTPRVIAIEPTCMQYMQQGLMRDFVAAIEEDFIVGRYAHFTNQSLNQEAARRGSIDGSLATLDLSEASDRVLNQLVIDMLKPWPDLSGAVQACRSSTAVIDGLNLEPVELVKFASMGSALTFPMEVIVFTTLVFMGLLEHAGDRVPTMKFHESGFVRNRVHIYGDDIIVPSSSVDAVVRNLELFGLKVNHGKSFAEGNFRESCGGDFFMGESVKPIRLKHLPPTARQDVSEIVSWVAFMNASYEAGMYYTGHFAQGLVERALNQPLSYIPRDSGALGVEVPNAVIAPERSNPWTHLPEVRALRVKHVNRKVGVDDIWALQKTLTGNWSDPMFSDHLRHSGRPASSRIEKAWVTVH